MTRQGLGCTGLSVSLSLLPPVLRGRKAGGQGYFCFKGSRTQVPESQCVQCSSGPLALSHPGPYLKKPRRVIQARSQDVSNLSWDSDSSLPLWSLPPGTSVGVLQESCWAAMEPDQENMTSLSPQPKAADATAASPLVRAGG